VREVPRISHGRRSVNGLIALRVPLDVIKAKCAHYVWRGKPERHTARQNLDDYDIVKTFGAEYRGIVQYYLLAVDVGRLSRLRWVAETSMLKTLAAKHQSTVSKMAARYRAIINTPHGKRVCFQASIERTGKQPLVARFGGRGRPLGLRGRNRPRTATRRRRARERFAAADAVVVELRADCPGFHPLVPKRPVGVLLAVAHGQFAPTPSTTRAVTLRHVRLVWVRRISAGNGSRKHKRHSTTQYRSAKASKL
jgi:hypothetical protein